MEAQKKTSVLEEKFGMSLRQEVEFNEKYSEDFASKQMFHNMKFLYLKKNIVSTINNGNATPCFVAKNASLTMFDVSKEDVQALNELLDFLINCAKIDVNKAPKYLQEDQPQFFRHDKFTTCFNKQCEMIQSLPKIGFKGQVAVKILGLQVEESHVKLLIHVQQVRVVEVNKEIDDNFNDECMFTDNQLFN